MHSLSSVDLILSHACFPSLYSTPIPSHTSFPSLHLTSITWHACTPSLYFNPYHFDPIILHTNFVLLFPRADVLFYPHLTRTHSKNLLARMYSFFSFGPLPSLECILFPYLYLSPRAHVFLRHI